jgi:hypothetical protein
MVRSPVDRGDRDHRLSRASVDICLGTRPIQAEKSRPLANAAPLPIAATIALEMIGPMPGTVMTLRQLLSLFAKASISSVTRAKSDDLKKRIEVIQ